jgi:hypothetical protein
VLATLDALDPETVNAAEGFAPAWRWSILTLSRIAMGYSEPDWPKTLEEFRAWHQRQPDVWEFIDGVPKLMAPGSMPIRC